MQNIALVGVFGSTEFINKNEMRSLPIKKSIVQITFRKQMCRLTGCGLFVKLTSFKVQKLLYFGHLIRRADSLEKTLMLGDWGQEEKGTTEDEMAGWMASLTRWMWVWVNSGSWWWTGRPGMLRFMGSQRIGHDWATELNWTELFYSLSMECFFHLLESSLISFISLRVFSVQAFYLLG